MRRAPSFSTRRLAPQRKEHAMSAEDADWLLRFLQEFASMSEQERDAAIDTLSPDQQGALVALADARTATAGADLVEVLDAGQGGLDRLYQLRQPADLF